MGIRLPSARPPVRLGALALLAVLLWMGAAWLVLPPLVSETSSDRFDLVRWEITRLPRKYLHATGAWLRNEPEPGREQLLAYFAEVRGRGRDGTSQEGSRHTATLRQDAEAALEAVLSREIERAGLDTPLPLLPGSVVWPPVDVSFDDTPNVLIVARRDRIELVRTEVLRPGLTAADIARIETEIERAGYSALVEPLGGFAVYPAVVRVSDGPREAVGIAAHEWVHHYLAFYPLGAAYGTSRGMTSINETVADIIGDELARAILARLELPAEPVRTAPGVNYWQVLRELRVEVDALLAQGEIAAAEARMEAVRQQLAEAGLYHRRINQAFLAFRNVYASSPGARNPIGPALQQLRRASPSLQAFVETVRDFDRPDDLDAALGAPPGTMTGVR